MKIVLTTLNAKYIHKNLALRWLYVARNKAMDVSIKEYTIKESVHRIVDELLAMNADLLAFSVYIWNIEQTKEIVRKLRSHSRTVKIVMGGPEVSYESFSLLEEGVDALLLGEGEQSFWQYVSMIEKQQDYEIAGVYTKTHPNTSVVKVDLSYNESLESPYFLPLDEKEMKQRYFYLETSRGCPYGCEYCLSSLDRKVRMFSEDYVMGILKQLAASEVKVVKVLDRTFNVMPKRALRIVRYINEHCCNQVFEFEIVAETLSEELLCFIEKEADKKRFRFEIGVQSFFDKTLHSVGRYQNNDRLMEVIQRMQKAGAVLHTDLIAGLPYENRQQFQQSFNTLFALKSQELQLGILKLLKGTRLKQQKEQYGMQMNQQAPYDVIETKWMSQEDMKLITQCAHAVEKYYNSGRFRYSIETILSLGLYGDAFSLFMELGKRMQTLSHPYQLHELFCLLIAVVDQDRSLVEAIVKYDYYRLSKQKPKSIFETRVEAKKKQKINAFIIEKQLLSEDVLYHYTHLDTIYYQGEVGVQLIVYARNQTYPKRYLIKENNWEEIK